MSAPEPADSPRVLCIAGSPRRNGNSDRLLDSLVAGVRAAGGTPVVLAARDCGVNFCRGCNACSEDGRCIQRDGMDAVYAELDAAEAIVIATPVFFATVPAVLKTLLDRCQPYWARRYVLHEPAPKHRRPGAILVVGGGGDPFGADCAVNPVKSVLNVLYVRSERILKVLGPDKPGDIASEPRALEQAENIGRELVAGVLENR
jgi:multimeric flavodoxin WrbA